MMQHEPIADFTQALITGMAIGLLAGILIGGAIVIMIQQKMIDTGKPKPL